MRNRLHRFFALTMLVLLAFGPVPSASAVPAYRSEVLGNPILSPHDQTPDIRLLASDATGLEIQVDVPQPALDQIEGSPGRFVQVSLPGYGPMAEAGQPALPQRGLLLGLPPQGEARIVQLDTRWENLPTSLPPAPAPTYRLPDQGDGSTQADALVPSIEANGPAYARAGTSWPSQPAVLGESAWLRDWRVVPLYLQPVRWDPSSGQLQVARSLHVRVEFDFPPDATGAQRLPADPFFDAIGRDSLFNHDQAQAWRQAPAMPEAPVAGERWEPNSSQPWLKVGVTQDGLAALSPGDLSAAGFDLAGVDPRSLQLWDAGRQIALFYLGNEGDGAFDGADRLVWYGQASRSRYTRENIYWLTAGGQSGLRAATLNVAPNAASPVASYTATSHVEENSVYIHDVPNQETSDRWRGQRLDAATAPQLLVQIPATDVAMGPAELTVKLISVTYQNGLAPDHHVEFSLNGQPVGELLWDDRTLITGTFTLPAGLLIGGNNQLLLHAPGDTCATLDVSHLDWAEIRYPRQFSMPAGGLVWDAAAGAQTFRITGLSQPEAVALDVTDPWASQALQNAQIQSQAGQWRLTFSRNAAGPRRYAVTTLGQLRSPNRLLMDVPAQWSFEGTGADYLAISHGDFLNSAQPLLDYRSQIGLRTALVDVQEIYDAYSDGELDAWAIRRFLADAYQNWPRPAPAFVLLIGSGHYDFQNFTGLASPRGQFIPPLLGCWDPWLCEVPSDNRYVTVSGADPLPDMLIGRLAVESVQQADAVVAKILGYEQAPPAGAWRSRALFISDNTHSATGQPEPAGNFESLNEDIIHLLPPSYQPQRIYFDPYPTDDGGEPFRHRTPAATTDAIIAGINQGAALLNYIGHAGNTAWAHEWLVRSSYTGRDDIALLTNGSRLSIGLSMACLSGNFAHPRFRSLDAGMVIWPNGGTVASWGASGFGVATGHDWLHRGFYEAAFDSGAVRMGVTTVLSKLNLFANTQSNRDLIDTFMLHGDPATRMFFGPELSIEHLPPAGPLGPGDPFSYQVTIANSGDVNQGAGLHLLLDMPPLDGMSVTALGTTISPDVAPGQWVLGDLAAGASAQVLVSGQVAMDITAAGLPLAVHSQLPDAWNDRDFHDNETGWAEIAATPSDLWLQWTTTAGILGPGSFVSATLTIGNSGPANTGQAQFTLDLPQELLDPQVTGPGLPVHPAPGATLTWLHSLAPGQQIQVEIEGVVSPDAGSQPLQFAAEGEPGWLDSNPANNQATLALPFAAPDGYEPDDTQAQATALPVPGLSPGHTGYPEFDRDWFRFSARRGVIYHMRIENLSEAADTVLSLYDANGTFIVKNDNYEPGVFWSGLDWRAPANADYYIMVTGLSADPAGYGYDLSVWATYLGFLPIASKD